MKQINRRKFLKASAATAAGLSLPFPSITQELSASDEVRVGVVGFRGRGGSHISGLGGIKGVRVTGLCDVDQHVLDEEAQKWEKKGAKVGAFRDIRKMLDSHSVDAISIATPNHWHALAAIWAVQAGKDVYVEKPVSHNVWEGRKLVEAARKHDKIVQTGTQARSSRAIREAAEWVREGNLGKLLISRGLCYKSRPSIGKVDGPQEPPAHVDYDLWCGPAPKDPVRRKQFHYDWHWFWNYGNGDLGNQGIHQMDIARWFLGEDALSPRVWSVGGRFGYEDDGETANTQIVYHDYPKAPLIFEVRGLPSKPGSKDMDRFPTEKGVNVGVIVHCEDGHLVVPSSYSSVTAFDKSGKEIKKWSGSDNHYENFIEAVRARKHTKLNADILEGHLSSALCHTGNISYRLGKKMSPAEIHDTIKSDRDAAESFGRMQEHLKINQVDLVSTEAQMGLFLKMDPKTERFIDNEEADKMLTREYRKPYVVPEKV
jgi:predicted dehydrogenase